MEEFASLILLSVVVEFIWEIIGNIWKDGKLDVNLLVVLLLGLIFAISTNTNIFDLLNISMEYEIVGIIATGIIISSGSNAVHELLAKLGSREREEI